MTMPTADPYFVCVTPRTGGTLLLDLPQGRAIVAGHRRRADELTAAWIERHHCESARS
ncbi:hypothetical protein ABT120_18585 [Nonomuraea angiospora]|uniref:hypothetical protein n=1 Tax=Nonomuraea angiospora TaxID=46172 RepID=UPI00331AEE24